MPSASQPFRFFDREEDVLVMERPQLPHWAQAGTLCFITWRTWDSMPIKVVEAWLAERQTWLRQHGIDADKDDWRNRVAGLAVPDRHEYHRTFSVRWEGALDECHGACVLRRPELAAVVAESLRFFDGDRYLLTDFVVMPNHVHLLAAFSSPDQMLTQCASWKHYTAVQINRALRRRGHFWEYDGFDHLVRGPEQLEYFRGYIAENPQRAHLRPGEFVHYTRKVLEWAVHNPG